MRPTAFLLPALLLALVTGCQAPAAPSSGQEATVSGPASPDKVKRGGVLRGTWSGTLPHLDLHQVGQHGTWVAANLMYNGLIEWDAFDRQQNTMVPGLAKSWDTNQDGTRFTFKLQEGVKFHDGTPFTADDVVFSLKRIIDPPRGTTSARKDQFTMVDRVEAPDRSTVTVTTKFPSSNFLALIADGWHAMVPKHVLEKDGSALKQSGMGTGPYRFKELVPDQRFVVLKNADYWKPGVPYLDGVELYRFGEETTIVAALLTNQLDMTTPSGSGLNVTSAQDLRKRAPQLIMESNPRLSVRGWRFNVSRPPFDNLKVRQALTLAVDLNEYLKYLTDDDGVPGTVVFPGSVWDLPKDEREKLTGHEPNMEDRLRRARQLLNEAGTGSGLTVTVLGTAGGTSQFEDHAMALETLWGRIGVKIKRDPVQSEEARKREADSLFDVFISGYGIATMDPVGVVGDHFICGAGRNTSKFCDPELDRLYEQQLKLLDQKERIKVVQEMTKRAVNSASMNVAYWNKEDHGRWPYVKDFIVTPSRYTLPSKLEYVWLDK